MNHSCNNLTLFLHQIRDALDGKKEDLSAAAAMVSVFA